MGHEHDSREKDHSHNHDHDHHHGNHHHGDLKERSCQQRTLETLGGDQMVKREGLIIILFMMQLGLISASAAHADMAAPTGEPLVIAYDAVERAGMDNDPLKATPIGVGPVAMGGALLDIEIALERVAAAVDIYCILGSSAVPGDVFFLTPQEGWQARSAGVIAWKTGVTGPLQDYLYQGVPTAGLPAGNYSLYLAAAPAGSLRSYYLWETGFTIEHPRFDMPSVTPESVGWSSSRLAEVTQTAETLGSAALMALYNGKVFLSWGDVSRNYWCHSIRKPLFGSLFGIHVANGAIDSEATLEVLGIDDIPPALTWQEKQAKVSDLLKSRSGVYHPAAAESQSMIDSRPARGSHPPGAFFYYNNWDFNALGAIFQQRTGADIFDEFKNRVADVIGMEDFMVENCYYQYEPSKSMHPAYVFRMSARDMARFGLLYLNEGAWDGQRVISRQWVVDSTRAYSEETDSGTGYGYLWKVAIEGGLMAQLAGEPFYYHTGDGVHLLAVIPKLKLVLVHRWDTDGDYVKPDGDAIFYMMMMIINAKSPNDLNRGPSNPQAVTKRLRQTSEPRRRCLAPGKKNFIANKKESRKARLPGDQTIY